MKIPKTTPDKPYIEFAFTLEGKLKLSITSYFWGPEDKGFLETDGSEGNSCKPEDLEKYIKFFKDKKSEQIQKDITKLKKRLKKVSKIKL